MVVLERLAFESPRGLPAACHAPGHEVVEAVEVEHAPVARVEVPVDVRPPELVAELHVVASRGVRQLANPCEFVSTRPRGSDRFAAERRVVPTRDQRQPEILRVAHRVEADRIRVEATVLGEEVLVEAVVAAPQLEQQLRRHDVRERGRGRLHRRRRHGVEARQQTARSQSEGKALVAVP